MKNHLSKCQSLKRCQSKKFVSTPTIYQGAGFPIIIITTKYVLCSGWLYYEKCCYKRGCTGISTVCWHIPSHKFLGVVQEDHMVIRFLFLVTCILISIVLHRFTFPSTVYKRFFCFTSLPSFVVVSFLDDSHSDWGEMESQCC
jgi:hypothetical protein